jgi:hypothetical protein
VIEEGKAAKEAALLTDTVRTVQHCIKKYNDDEKRLCLSALGNLELGAKLGSQLINQLAKSPLCKRNGAIPPTKF